MYQFFKIGDVISLRKNQKVVVGKISKIQYFAYEKQFKIITFITIENNDLVLKFQANDCFLTLLKFKL